MKQERVWMWKCDGQLEEDDPSCLTLSAFFVFQAIKQASWAPGETGQGARRSLSPS